MLKVQASEVCVRVYGMGACITQRASVVLLLSLKQYNYSRLRLRQNTQHLQAFVLCSRLLHAVRTDSAGTCARLTDRAL